MPGYYWVQLLSCTTALAVARLQASSKAARHKTKRTNLINFEEDDACALTGGLRFGLHGPDICKVDGVRGGEGDFKALMSGGWS